LDTEVVKVSTIHKITDQTINCYIYRLTGDRSTWSLTACTLDNYCNCLPPVADVPHANWGNTTDGPNYRRYG